MTPYQYAIDNGHLSIVEFFVKQGVDILSQNKWVWL